MARREPGVNGCLLGSQADFSLNPKDRGLRASGDSQSQVSCVSFDLRAGVVARGLLGIEAAAFAVIAHAPDVSPRRAVGFGGQQTASAYWLMPMTLGRETQSMASMYTV